MDARNIKNDVKVALTRSITGINVKEDEGFDVDDQMEEAKGVLEDN